MNTNPSDRPTLDDYDDEAARYPQRRQNRTLRCIGKCIKWFFIALIVFVFVLMIWRIRTMEQLPREILTLQVNEATYRAYAEAKARGEEPEMFTQGKIDPVTTNSEAYGYFWLADSVMIPDAQQLQLVVQYNNSTLEHLATDFKLGEIPSRETEVLSLRLRIIRDATPDDPTDDDEESAQLTHTLTPTGSPVAVKKDVYNYRRYLFDGVTIDDDVIGIKVEFYYAGAADAEQPLGELYVYYQEAKNVTVKLTKNDRAALEDFGQK